MQRQDIKLFLSCVEHRQNYYQFLSIKKDDPKKLLCPECLIPNVKVVRQLDELIPLSIAMNLPEELFKYMHKNNNDSLYKAFKFSDRNLEIEFNQQIEKMDQCLIILNDIKESMKKQLSEYLIVQKSVKMDQQIFLQNSNYSQFQRLILQLQELDKYYQSDEYKQVFQELTFTINQMLNNKKVWACPEFEKLKEKYSHSQVKYKFYRLEQLQKIDLLLKNYDNYLTQLNNQISFKPSSIMSNNYFETLEQKIIDVTQKAIKSINLIYLGSRHGLNIHSFWNKINGKNNLFMIFESKEGNICGAFSPCQWKSNFDQYVKDEKKHSFLFSGSFQECLFLKESCKYYAIQCCSREGPKFGMNDFSVGSNFREVKSTLGGSYQFNDTKEQNSKNLFGENNPVIAECEIYEIIFA